MTPAKIHPGRRNRPFDLRRIGPNHASRSLKSLHDVSARPARIAAMPRAKRNGTSAVEAPKSGESEDEGEPDEDLLRPSRGSRGGPPPSPAHGRPAGADIEGVVGAVGDAIEALHAAGVDDHPVIADLLVDPDVRCAHRGAGRASFARIGDPDPHRRQPIGHSEGRPVGAAVGAEPLGAEHENHRESAHREGQHGDADTRECRPEIRRQELGSDRSEGLPGADLVDCRPEKHVDKRREGHQPEHPRAQGPRSDPDLDQQPATEILQRDEMASPAAEEPSEDRGGENRGHEEDQTGVDDSVFGELHALGRLDRTERHTAQDPLSEMGDHDEMHRDERDGPPERGVPRSKTARLDHRETHRR